MIRRFPHQLSGGQKQRVMIAMAMSTGPSLLICDEPTTALDVTVQKAILDLIKEWQQSANMGVIFITHDLGVVKQIADRVLVMHKGAVLEEGSINQIFYQPTHPYTKGLLACRPALQPKGKRLPVVSDFWDPERTVSTPLPVSPAPMANKPDKGTTGSNSGQVLMKVENISVWYPGRKNFLGRVTEYNKAVDELSFDVLEGETLGLVGESGCGKSTLGRCLLNLIQPNNGKIWYKGSSLSGLKGSAMKNLRREMQIVFQDPYSSLNPRIKIGEAIAEPLMVHRLVRGNRAQKDRAAALLEKVGLSASHLQRYPHEFSGGQRQRIVIARALALNPSFLVCDESVSALDVSVQAQVLNLLNDLKKEYGFTIIFISHDLSVVRYISDRIMVMRKGKIVESGEANAVYESPQSDYTRQLLASVPAW
jgi:peptide/nickel transport system ATP-binding protein